MFSEVSECHSIVMASSPAKFKPNASATMLCGWETILRRGWMYLFFSFSPVFRCRFLFKLDSGDLLGSFLPGPRGLKH